MAARVLATIGWVAVALALASGLSPAHAEGCYPPPCGSPGITVAGSVVDVNAGVISSTSQADRPTALAFAGAGLLMVTTTLTTVCLRRRADLVVPAGLPGRERAASGPGPPSPGRSLEGSLG